MVSTSTTTTHLSTSSARITTTVTQLPPITTSNPPPPPTTTSNTALSCSIGFQSCAASVGGGCCPTDRACGSPACPPLSMPSTTSTGSAVAPVRPTTSAPESTGLIDNGCPTGFYVCSAFYVAGCCRVGRDCNPTSCPPPANTNVIVSNGITIIAPSGATAATRSATTTASLIGGDRGNCAKGWYTCGSNDGGGCCPSGFACGTSCTALPGASGTGLVQKVNGAGRIAGLSDKWCLLLVAFATYLFY